MSKSEDRRNAVQRRADIVNLQRVRQEQLRPLAELRAKVSLTTLPTSITIVDGVVTYKYDAKTTKLMKNIDDVIEQLNKYFEERIKDHGSNS